MPDTRTAVSEIVTGLGLYGFRDLAQALAARPRFITNVDDDVARGGASILHVVGRPVSVAMPPVQLPDEARRRPELPLGLSAGV